MSLIKTELPAFNSNQLGSVSSVKADIFSRNMQYVDIQVVGTRTAADGANYTGKTGAAITAMPPSVGTGAAGTLTVGPDGVPTAIAITAGGSSWVVGDKFTIYDPTGIGLVCAVATVTSGAITTATLGGGPMFAEDVIEYVEVVQDSETKSRFSPALQRKLDLLLNVTDDLPSKSKMRIPFANTWHPWSQWGSRNIGQLTLDVKLKDPAAVAGTFQRIRGTYCYRPVAVAQDRGAVLIQGNIPITNVVGGTNKINDLPWQKVVALTKMIFDAAAITKVKVSIGDVVIYNSTKDDALFDLQQSAQYRDPSLTEKNRGTMDYFPVILDDAAAVEDFHYIVADENGTLARRPVQIEFFWDTGIAPAAAFTLLAQGLERDAKQTVAVAKV